jgi:hypothetical protein
MTSELFFFPTGTCREDPQFLQIVFIFKTYVRRRHVEGRASTTGQHFLGNKRLGTFQITDSRLRDQTTVDSNYLLGKKGPCGPNEF